MPDLPDSDELREEPQPEGSQPAAGPPGGEVNMPTEPPVPPKETFLPEKPAEPEKALPTVEETPPVSSPLFKRESLVAEETPSPFSAERQSKEPTPPTEAGIPLTKEQPEVTPSVSEIGEPSEAVLPSPETVPPETPPPFPPPAGPQPEAGPPPTEAEAFHVERRSPFDLIKKILPLIFIALVVLAGAFVIFRFVLPRVGKTKEITLNYWGLWEAESVMQEVLTEWEKEHSNIKISYSRQSPKEYRERLQSALARGEGPDIFRFHNTWLPMFKNELEPVPAKVMDAGAFESAFYPVAVSSLRSGANYVGIPLEIDTLSLFYNQAIFTAAGASPPKTWDELRQLASALTLRDEDGRIRRAGVALGTTSNIWHWSDILGLMILQNGADLTNPTGSLAEDALTFYTIFSKTDRVWDNTLPSSLLAFASGKTAMFFGFSWDVFEIKNLNPNLNFKIVPVPQLPETEITWASFWVEGVAKKSENKEAAWEFLKFLSSKEVMEKLYQGASKTRLFGEPYSRVEMASMLQADPMISPFVSQAAKAQTWYLCSRTFDNGINDRMIKYFEDAVNAVNVGDSTKEALAAAAGGVAQVLSQYGLGSYTTR